MKILLLFLFAILMQACSSGTGPDHKNPRKFSWTSDTLLYPNSIQTMMKEIWASAPKDVYLIGHCDFDDGSLYHFDGKSWHNIDLNIRSGGPINGAYDLNDVFGFSADDIYVVGDKDGPDHDRQSMIVHFDGTKWEEIDVPPKESLLSIWGSTPDDIWAGGNSGTLFHYDGSQWKADSLPHPGYPDYDVFLNINDINGYSADSVFFSTLSVLPLGELLDHFFLYSKSKITLLDSTNRHTYETWLSPQGTLYKATNYGIFMKNNDHWNTFYGDHYVLSMTGMFYITMVPTGIHSKTFL